MTVAASKPRRFVVYASEIYNEDAVDGLASRLLYGHGMRRLAALALLVATPVLADNRTSFHIGARVVDSTTVSAEVGATSIRLKTATRASSLIQVGSSAPVPASHEQTISAPAGGDVVVTLLY